jgi:F-type H+-transporting ATPase subunit b
MLIQLLIIQIITFVVLLLVLRSVFSRNLNTALTRLNALNEENLVKEAQLTDELKRAQEERESEVLKGKQAANALIEEAKQEAIKQRLIMEEEARKQSQKIINQAKEEALDLKEKLSRQLEKHSLDLAVKMIEQTFNDLDKEELQHQFITEIIDEIAKLTKDKFTVSSDKVKVTSTYSLQDKQRQNLKRVLEEKLGCAITLEEAIDQALISGLTVEIGGLVIDGTLRNKLYKVMPDLEKTA